MKRLLIIAALLVPSLALAQQPSPQEFTLKLTAAEVQTVGKALDELSYKEAAPVIQKLREQIIQQQTPPKPVAAPLPTPPTGKKE